MAGGDSYEAIDCLASEILPVVAYFSNEGEFDEKGDFHRVIHRIGGDTVFLLESLGFKGPNSTYWCGSCLTKGLAQLFESAEKGIMRKR